MLTKDVERVWSVLCDVVDYWDGFLVSGRLPVLAPARDRIVPSGML